MAGLATTKVEESIMAPAWWDESIRFGKPEPLRLTAAASFIQVLMTVGIGGNPSGNRNVSMSVVGRDRAVFH